MVSSDAGTIAVFRDTTTGAATPAPTPGEGASTSPDEQEWYERHAVLLGLGAVAATTAASGLVWLLIGNGCCAMVALAARRKRKVHCPACDKKIEVKKKGLKSRTACSCDVARGKAETEAGSSSPTSPKGDTGKRKILLFHPDPRHIETCPHCKTVVCVPCDVRDKKGMFPFLFENNPEGGKKNNTGEAADPSAVEVGIDDAASTPTSL